MSQPEDPSAARCTLMLLSMVVRAEDLVGRRGLVISSLVLAGSLVAWARNSFIKMLDESAPIVAMSLQM